jgi:hypothetical protein
LVFEDEHDDEDAFFCDFVPWLIRFGGFDKKTGRVVSVPGFSFAKIPASADGGT